MKAKAAFAVALFLALGVTGVVACNTPEDTSQNPVLNKYIAPPEYKTIQDCVKMDETGKKCVKHSPFRKEIDDKDWVIVTINGEYDVTEEEYNSVEKGDMWPPKSD